MKKRSSTLLSLSITLLLVLVILLSGCNSRTPATPEATPITPTPEATATATAVPARIVLFDPAAQSKPELAAMLGEFAAANSLSFETWTALTGSLDGIKVMIVNGTIENLTEIASSAPQTQFVLLSPTLAPAANISVITTNLTHQAFLAGYLAAMTAEDWRAGALIVDDAILGLSNAFINGGQYLCGGCTPQFAPMLYYPQVYIVPDQSPANIWSTQAIALVTDTAVNSVFLDGGGDSPEVLDQFTNAILFGNNPASANLSRYSAILGADATSAIQEALPDLLAGNGGKTLTAQVSLVVINNTDVVSPGKQARFDEVAKALMENQINPLSIP